MDKIIKITDIAAPELDMFARLTEAQLRNRLEPEKGVFICESAKAIRVALAAGCAPKALLMERRHLTGQGAELMALCPDAAVYTADREVLEKLTGYTVNRGILCAMARPTPKTVEEVCAGARRVAVLEDITDSTNVGAVFRSAAALGMDGVLLSESCCDPLNRRAVRVSMGTVLQVPWAYLSGWPEEGMARLHELGFKTAAMALSDDSVPVDDPALKAELRGGGLLGAAGKITKTAGHFGAAEEVYMA